ncbi:MFS transporter [Streptomyces sp. NPDC012623]|uniref:MFS transporter n=1 Tax=unclassified Streptomyces TaxID=2593676 RepID=UPI0036BEEC10
MSRTHGAPPARDGYADGYAKEREGVGEGPGGSGAAAPPGSPGAPGAERADRRLPWAGLLAMAWTGFVVIMTETLPAGLLPEIASGLDVTESGAGQLVSAYAAGTVLAALPATALTRGMRRKPLLLTGILGFAVANTVTALAGDYTIALAARFVAGAFSGLLWGMLAGYARRIAPPGQQGRALAVAMVGTPVALSIGTPLGTFAGALVSWRWVFGAMTALSLVLAVFAWVKVPDAPGQSAEARTPLPRVLLTPGVLPILTVVFSWMLAHNILYTYIAPFTSYAGVGIRVDLALLLFGLAALAGIWVTGTFVDRALRALALTSLAAFGLAALAFALVAQNPVAFCAAVLVWGFTFGGSATQLQTASADAAGNDADVANAMLTTSFNLAIFGGGAFGGLLLESGGAGTFPWVLLALVAVSLVIVATARRHAFVPGPRGNR